MLCTQYALSIWKSMPFLNYLFYHFLPLCFLDFMVGNCYYLEVDCPRTGFSKSSPDQLHLHQLRTCWNSDLLNQKLYLRGTAISVLRSPPGDSDASYRITISNSPSNISYCCFSHLPHFLSFHLFVRNFLNIILQFFHCIFHPFYQKYQVLISE